MNLLSEFDTSDYVASTDVSALVRTPAATSAEDTLIAELDALAREEREALARGLLQSLHDFVRHFWHVVEPKAAFVDNWHIVELCTVLEEIERGGPSRTLINVPPGTMKSLLTSVFFNGWVWAKDPSKRVFTASYSDNNTIRDNRKLRDLVLSPEYQELYPHVQLVKDQNVKTKFETTEKGWRIASSVKGAGTGEHPDYILIDDPVNAKEAKDDAAALYAANDWFDGTISSRGVTRGVKILVIMQRLHEDDLSGHLLQRGGWQHICWPMWYEIERKNDPTFKPDPRDPRTEVGQPLWPELFTAEKLRTLELDLGPYGVAGQLQQNPAPEGGGLFKREWFVIVDAGPKVAKRRRGWDTAGTEDGGDWTVGVKIAEAPDGRFYVEDVVREQVEADKLDALIKQTAQLDGRRVGQREEKEGGSAGKAVILARAKLLKQHDYLGVVVSGDKVTRAKPFRSQCAAGNVFLVRGDWNEEYIRELTKFPTGKHDDQVDGSSCAYNSLVEDPPPPGGQLAGKLTW